MTQNVTENITMTQNVPEESNSTIIQTFSDIFYSLFTPNTESKANTTRKLIKSLTDEQIYDKTLRPNYGEKAVAVYLYIYVGDIISVSDYTNDFAVNIQVFQKWIDPRLQFTPLNNVSNLLLVRDTAKLIWLADTTVQNGKSLSMQLSASILDNARIYVTSDGIVVYGYTFSATANCPMDLAYFPVDQQICKLIFRSYSFNNQDVTLSWHPVPRPVLIEPNISLSTFTLTSYNASKETLYDGLVDKLTCELRFNRALGYYINQIYVPSFMIVVVSWIPFWLNRADHYARVGLGVTTVLTITTMVISTNESLPKTSYIKAIDIYLFVCFLMVFLAMIEFAAIGFFEFEEQSNTAMETKNEEPVADKVDDKIDKSKASKTKRRDTARIDKVSRVLFPAVFITFNLIYVGVLYYISNNLYNSVDHRFKYEG